VQLANLVVLSSPSCHHSVLNFLNIIQILQETLHLYSHCGCLFLLVLTLAECPKNVSFPAMCKNRGRNLHITDNWLVCTGYVCLFFFFLLTFVMHNFSIFFSLFLSVMIIYQEDNRVFASLECLLICGIVLSKATLSDRAMIRNYHLRHWEGHEVLHLCSQISAHTVASGSSYLVQTRQRIKDLTNPHDI